MKKILIIIIVLMSLGTTNVSAYSKDSDEYKTCAAKCAYMLDENGEVKENYNSTYGSCMSPCNAGLDEKIELDKQHHQEKVEQLTKSPVEFCAQTAVIWQIVGWVLLVFKIVIPIILIILGVIDLSKAVVSSKDDEIKKSMKTLMMRAISAIVIFFIPTIVGIVMGLIVDFTNSGAKADYEVCKTCILDPGDCDTSKDASKN